MLKQSRVALVVAVLAVPHAVAAKRPVKLLTAGYWGTAEDDDLQGGTQAADGTVYIVGNVGTAGRDLPGGVPPKVFGEPVAEPKCGRGFIAHLSADLGKLLHYAELANGIVIFTSAQVTKDRLYVSGYASDGLQPLLQDKRGLMREYPLATEARLIREGKILEATGLQDKDPIAGRPGLGRLGAPCVLRFTPDLQTLTAGTYLEGWQQVWDKFRCETIRPRSTFPREFFWQPTSLGLLKRLAFYDCCDWVSRLSPDLSQRVWRRPVYTPAVDAETAKRALSGWPLPHYSSPRTHRMRLDRDENIFLCGWSASYTINEPWWSPYLWKLNSADDRFLVVGRARNPTAPTAHALFDKSRGKADGFYYLVEAVRPTAHE